MIIGIEKFDDTKILMGIDKLSDITLKYVKVLTCVMKDGDKIYLQIFLEEALLA